MPEKPDLLPKVGTPNTIALRLALRAARKKRGVGVRELARGLDLPASQISGLEVGHVSITCEKVANVLGFLQVSRADYRRLTGLAQEADHLTYIERRIPTYPALTETYELIAMTQTEWAPRLIPEALQSPGYLRAFLRSTYPNDDELDVAVFSRIVERGTRASMPNADCSYKFLVGEAALRPAIADVTTMLEQLHHLLEVSTLPNVVIQVVRENDYHPDLRGARTTYELDRSPTVVVLHDRDTKIYLSRPDDVAPHVAAVDAIANQALTTDRSQKLIVKAVRELQSKIDKAC